MELLGSYDPHKNVITADQDKIKYWLSKGAKLSPTLNNLLVGRKIIEGEKVTVWKAKKKEKKETKTIPEDQMEKREEKAVSEKLPEENEPNDKTAV